MLPHPRIFIPLGLWLALGLALPWLPAGVQVLAGFPIWGLAGSVLALGLVVDAVRLWRIPAPTLSRQVSGSLPLGEWRQAGLRLDNRHRTPIRVEVFDHHPPEIESEGLPRTAVIAGGHWAKFSYRLRPTERGRLDFQPAQVWLASPWRLWRRNLRLGNSEEVHVYPNFAAVMKYALLAHDQRLAQLGIRLHRRRGEGLEFHQLREYREGDSLRQIDWNASARTRRLISREYQDERDQRVFFLLDCSRRMRAEDGALSHFDHCLNAVLLLTHVALRQGDAVGLLSFSGDTRWLAPRKRQGTQNLILNTVFDLQPGTLAPDYLQAAREFMQRQQKRSLVILITNLRDEDTDDLLPALRLLQRKHLVLLASLREQSLFDQLERPVADFTDALTTAATHQYLQLRRDAHRQLQQQVTTLDVTPAQLPVHLVNRYLDIKRSGRL